MFIVASECQTRWVRLRQRFSKERQQRELETRSGAGKPTRQKWFLFDNLNFLSRFVFQRKSLSNVGTKVNMNQNYVQNQCYQDDINVTPAASMVLQAPVCSPLQQSTPSPLQQLTTSQLQQPPSPMLRSIPSPLQHSNPPILRSTPSPLEQPLSPMQRSVKVPNRGPSSYDLDLQGQG
ncbi:PREDICTED: uncharacterized protein LOC105556417, partial [Vollenhovia emeryi]|uniref:uncharacterized protein LOC105556417 n=1 Tax=Vollenhovia emeryi TaxID=411798 RepID=UPI0005F50726